MSQITISGVSLPGEMMLAVIYVVWVIALLTIKKIVTAVLLRFAKQTRSDLDDVVVAALHVPLVLLIFASGGFVIAKVLAPEAGAEFLKSFLPVFKVVMILAVVLFSNKFLAALVREYTPRFEILRDTAGIVHAAIRVVIFGLGALVLLDSFGVSITPIIASLGIGSLAIALALQPTLENLFAGIQVVIDRPIQVGHFIRLESGEEGYVERIGWRTTWIRLPPNNVVILQNKNLVNSKILNYYYPDTQTAVTVEVGVHYDSDLEKVEKVTLDVARQTLKAVPEAVADFEPVVRYHDLGSSSVDFTVVLRIQEVTQSAILKHEFIKRLLKRYAQEGIVIPYPVQAINLSQEKALTAFSKNG